MFIDVLSLAFLFFGVLVLFVFPVTLPRVVPLREIMSLHFEDAGRTLGIVLFHFFSVDSFQK